MIFIQNKLIPFKGFNAITIFPFVFYKKDSQRMRRHEKIHGKQQLEMLWLSGVVVLGLFSKLGYNPWYFTILLSYYAIYILEWLIRLILQGKSKAYYNVSFEAEAYINENYYNYTEYRNNFAWIKYIF